MNILYNFSCQVMKLKNYPISIKEQVTLSEYFYSVADEELCRGDDKNTEPIQVYS